jgi:ribosomal-protein-alanine N-acetyltransferase
MKTQDYKNSDNISIFSMKEPDIKDVLQIQNESGLSPWTHLDYAKEIESEDSICTVAKFKEEIIGFAIVKLLVEQDENSAKVYNSSEIYNIAVKNTFQGRGTGQKIFDKIVSDLRKKNVLDIWLEVRESNTKALRFYQKNGFSKEFIRKNYYSQPLENAHILKLSLNYEDQI